MNVSVIAVTVHIISVILWVGGGLALLLGAQMARHKRGAAAVLPVVDVVALLGPVFFVPVSLVTLLSGLAAAWFGPGFGHLWINLGLAGFATTFLTGILLIKPRAEEIARLMADATTQQATLVGKSLDLVTIAQFDYVILGLVVLDMALKPTLNDITLLVVFAVIAVIGAMLTLVKGLQSKAVAT
ncbi:MAG: DUF2269 family protein [Limimaricola sp.]|uniref:DUF2269 family protein n=1 Tax=Limimaricola sp. TaxID=2211665 RepID=UPI001D5006B8|nr:DUF2269 family protein [Limimaricola sp.]MBI1417876.1 DUF2269 family protein [Limimaricola sp.]